LKKTLKRNGRVDVITTDGLRFYKVAMVETAARRKRRSAAGPTTA
jgi:transposase-like protein